MLHQNKLIDIFKQSTLFEFSTKMATSILKILYTRKILIYFISAEVEKKLHRLACSYGTYIGLEEVKEYDLFKWLLSLKTSYNIYNIVFFSDIHTIFIIADV